jgi:hypothetical protein
MVTFFDHEIEAPTEFVTQRGTPRSQETSRTILRQKRRRSEWRNTDHWNDRPPQMRLSCAGNSVLNGLRRWTRLSQNSATTRLASRS